MILVRPSRFTLRTDLLSAALAAWRLSSSMRRWDSGPAPIAFATARLPQTQQLGRTLLRTSCFPISVTRHR